MKLKIQLYSEAVFFFHKISLMELTRFVSGTGHGALLDLFAEEDEMNALRT